MKKITVQVRDDHLAFLSRAKPMTAISELIWNALDAEATEVHIDFVENDLGGVDTVRISDNGFGLNYDDAQVAFRNLGGSWKRVEGGTPTRHRALHGKYGKGRFRAFGLGNHVEWTTVYHREDKAFRYTILGRAATLGEFTLTDPLACGDTPTGMTVEIADLPSNIDVLRGVKARQEVTDLFALYLSQYPDVRVVYDGVPLDPANAEDRSVDYPLGEIVLQNGERVEATLTVTEWNIPGKRGIVLSDEKGFALQTVKPKLLFRGFSYTAHLKCAHFTELEAEGVLQLDEMSPDVKQIVGEARTALRQHFTLREVERAQDVLAQWKAAGLYPYEGEPADEAEEGERRIFDIYATHLNQMPDFANASQRNKRLNLRFLQELVRTDATRVVRILDELRTLPEDKEEELLELAQGQDSTE